MIPLHQSILRGAERCPQHHRGAYFAADERGADVLGAAYIGKPRDERLDHAWSILRPFTQPQLCAYMIHDLNKSWPQLGGTVRQWPRFAEELERDRLIPRLRTNQVSYRQEIHVSLWKVLTDLEAGGESREAIAARLAGHGL